jgi:radical SAM protein with 4Fe4S-binding SPASM domain
MTMNNPTPHDIFLSEGIRLPKTLTIAITPDCNLSCSHCWVEAGEAPTTAHVPEWSLLNIIRSFADLGGENICFTGGEPLRHPGWLRVMQFANTIGLSGITLQTNGILITDRHVKQLRLSGLPRLKIQISLDGATADVHDKVRGHGAFAATMKGLDRLVQGGLGHNVTIHFTEMRHNLEEFPDLLELAEQRGFASVVAGTLVSCSRADMSDSIEPPDCDQYLRLIDRYNNDPAFRKRYDSIGSMAALIWRKGDTPRTECCTFAEHPYLTPDGRLYPCLMFHNDDFSVTGVYEKGLEAALAEGARLWSPLQHISRSRLASLPECQDCTGFAACAGGCMGRAWSSCGSLLAKDDRCSVRQTIYQCYKPLD